VAANACGIPEVVVTNETGYLAEVRNPESFADKVEELLNNKELQKKFTENGYEFLKNNFTKEIIAKKMIDELQEVVNQNPVKNEKGK
jgi:glycosyltransferase involved in cell wall biosynthesis